MILSSYQPLIFAFHESLSGRDYATLRSLLAENVNFDFPALPVVVGRPQTILLLKKIRAEFTALEFEISNIFSQNSFYACEWRNRGTLLNGTPFTNRGVTIFQITAEKIEKISDYFKASAVNFH